MWIMPKTDSITEIPQDKWFGVKSFNSAVESIMDREEKTWKWAFLKSQESRQ